MKIAHVTFSSESGGAAIAAGRLNAAMRRCGLDSYLITRANLSAQPMGKSLRRELLEVLQKRKYQDSPRKLFSDYKADGTWSEGYGRNVISSNLLFRTADVIYLHWVNMETLSIEEIGKLLATGKQVVWFMHDMWPLTGGCHHAFECKKYEEHCGNCPMLKSGTEQDLTYQVFERKLKSWSNFPNLNVITPSLWLSECAQKSRLFAGRKTAAIPNIIDTQVFRPIDKRAARVVLGMPSDKKLLLFGCDGGSKNFYKGWPYLEDALRKLELSEYELMVFGEETNADAMEQFKTKVHFLGRMKDARTSLALAYSAADVFISPSIAENFSLTLCEASACGTPVVCFDVGGNSDIILHKQTGYLAQYKNSGDLAAGIAWVFENNHSDCLSKNAREHIVKLCSEEVVVRQHLNFLNTITNKK